MDKSKEISDFVKRKIEGIARLPDNQQKALLAEMRHGLGKKPGELPALWGLIFENLPEEWMGKNGEASREEQAIYATLTLYALHQQGKDASENMNDEGTAFGGAVARLASDPDEVERIRKRFAILFSATDISGLSHYLRGMVQMLRKEGIGFNYPKLAADLYWFQFPEAAAGVRLAWGQDYYRALNKKKEEIQDEQ
jgi:CRISPR system Cascade subunit CasB